MDSTTQIVLVAVVGLIFLFVGWRELLALIIGIIVGTDTITKEEKAYIGIGQGGDELDDTISILQYGAKFPIEAAKKLI